MKAVKMNSKNMLEGPLVPSIIRYTVPIIFTGLLQLLFNAADLVIVGQFCGSIYVGAVGATGPLTHLIINLFIGLSVGAGASVAFSLGAGDDQAVHRTVHTAIPLSLVGGVVLTFVGVLYSEPMLRMMDTPDSVLPLATTYMEIYFAGITFTVIYNFAAAILRAAGDTKSPLIFLIIAGFINVGLNIFFVTALHMNVAGVALATIISQGISALLVLWALMRRTDACRLFLPRLHFYKPQLLRIVRIGLPAGIQSSLFGISNVIVQSSINSFGDAVIAGNSAAANIDGFLYVFLNSFHQTALNFIGQNTGAGQYRRGNRIMWLCMAFTTLCGLVLGIVTYLFGPQLLGFYITDSPAAISYGMVRLLFICLPYFVFGIMDVSTGALRGLGEGMVPMVISVLGVCGIRVFWIYTIFQIPRFHTLECLYLSYLISWIVTLAAQVIAYHKVFRRISSTSPLL